MAMTNDDLPSMSIGALITGIVVVAVAAAIGGIIAIRSVHAQQKSTTAESGDSEKCYQWTVWIPRTTVYFYTDSIKAVNGSMGFIDSTGVYRVVQGDAVYTLNKCETPIDKAPTL
jgi:hypothetical protein